MAPMTSRRSMAGTTVVLLLIGTWLGHTVEYARTWGTRGLRTELLGSVHVYMLPLAIVLALFAVVAGTRLWRAWMALGARLDDSRRRLRAALRGKRVAIADARPSRVPSLSSRLLIAWPALTTAQVALYAAQESVEAAARHLPVPGLGAVGGTHAWAIAVHAVVALALLAGLAAVSRLLRHRDDAVLAVERVLRLLARRWTCAADAVRPGRAIRTIAPLSLFGHHLRQRPPPLLVTS